MTGWRQMEQYIKDCNLAGRRLSTDEVGMRCGIPPWTAGSLIQRYKLAQRRGKTQNVIRRIPGTRGKNTRWWIGTQEVDVEGVLGLPVSDLAWNVRLGVQDLQAIRAINPQLGVEVEEAIEVLELGARLLEALPVLM